MVMMVGHQMKVRVDNVGTVAIKCIIRVTVSLAQPNIITIYLHPPFMKFT